VACDAIGACGNQVAATEPESRDDKLAKIIAGKYINRLVVKRFKFLVWQIKEGNSRTISLLQKWAGPVLEMRRDVNDLVGENISAGRVKPAKLINS
jgi:hypothetical protein